MRESGKLTLGSAAAAGISSAREIDFDVDEDVVLHRRKRLPFHSNAMLFSAIDSDARELASRTYYSVGGGFVLGGDQAGGPQLVPDAVAVPYPFGCGAELLERTAGQRTADQRRHAGQRAGPPRAGSGGSSLAARMTEAEVRAGLARIWSVMQECVEAGCAHAGRAARRAESPAPGQ